MINDKKYRYLIFAINFHTNSIDIDKCGQRDEQFSNFKDALPEDMPRYAVYDFD